MLIVQAQKNKTKTGYVISCYVNVCVSEEWDLNHKKDRPQREKSLEIYIYIYIYLEKSQFHLEGNE